MNDKTMMQAIRKLHPKWVSDDTNVTRFGPRGIVACNPSFAAMQFSRGRWVKIDPTTRTWR